MRRLMLHVLITGSFFLAPLLGTPCLLATAGPWLAALIWTVLLRSQPTLDSSDRAADHGSAFAIAAAMIAGQSAAVADLLVAASPAPLSATVGGAILAAGGLWLRIRAVATLGNRFTSRVVGRSHLVESGPYRIVRHPSYTGAMAAAIGAAVALGSAVGALLTTVAGGAAYLYRVRVEEAAMAEAGADYRAYRARTWAFVPYLY